MKNIKRDSMIMLPIILVIFGSIALVLINTIDFNFKSNNTKEESSKKGIKEEAKKIDENILEELVNNVLQSNLSLLISTGETDNNLKMLVAFNNVLKYSKDNSLYDKIANCRKVFSGSSIATYNSSNDEYKILNNGKEGFCSSDYSFSFSYDELNNEYKKLFNREAERIDITEGEYISAYYDSKNDQFIALSNHQNYINNYSYTIVNYKIKDNILKVQVDYNYNNEEGSIYLNYEYVNDMYILESVSKK